jgi:tetratricopeptide (TPR) repeat protein
VDSPAEDPDPDPVATGKPFRLPSSAFRSLLIAGILLLGACEKPPTLVDEAEKLKRDEKYELSKNMAEAGLKRFTNPSDPVHWRFEILKQALGCREDKEPSISLPASLQKTETEVRVLWLQAECAESEAAKIPWLDQAFELSKSLNRPDLRMLSEYRRSDALAKTGRLEEASDGFQQVVDWSRATNNQALLPSALGNLAFVRIKTDRYDESIALCKEAQSSPNVAAYIRARLENNLGWSYLELGDAERAVPYFNQAVATYADVNAPESRSTVFRNLAEHFWKRGDFAGANRNLGLAIEALGDKPNTRALAGIWLEWAEAHRLEGKIDQARSDMVKAEKLWPATPDGSELETLRQMESARIESGTNPRRSEAILRQVAVSDSARSDWRMEAHTGLAKLLIRRGALAEAESEYRAAIDLIETRRVRLDREDSKMIFFDAVNRLYHDYVELLLKQKREPDAFSLADSSRARMLSEKNGSTMPGVDLKLLQDQLGSASAIALSYWLGPDRSFLWVVTPTGFHRVDLPAEHEILTHARRYVDALQHSKPFTPAVKADGVWLRKNLVDRAGKWLGKTGSRVFVVTDDALGFLNPEALPGATHQWWIEEAVVSVAPSLAMLQRPLPQPQSTQLLAIGDPDVVSDEFPKLAGAARELSGIQAKFPSSLILREARATPDSYEKSHPERFAIIHFAAHGNAVTDNPLDSSIILSGTPSHYKLYARDVDKIQLNARLVTVSACRSAGSRSYRGEGPVGLAWAFLRAGAGQVVAGLWPVTDEPGAIIMDKFYAGLKQGQTPAAALREAKLALISSAAIYREKPYYWAPFEVFAGVVEP